MQTVLRTSLLALALAAGGTAQAQQPLTEIKVSYQPALYWALPFYIATEKNWWAEVGLKPVFSTFPAGVPQIAASASYGWVAYPDQIVPPTPGEDWAKNVTAGLSLSVPLFS